MTQRKEDEPTDGIVERTRMGGVHGAFTLHIHAVTNLLAGTELTLNEKDTLRDAGSNEINNPYVWIWQGRYPYPAVGPRVTSPSSTLHLALLEQTRMEYDRLQNQQMRIYLAGEEGADVEDPKAPISLEESRHYLTRAQDRGVIEGFSDSTPPIQIKRNLIRLFMALQKENVSIRDDRISEFLEILFTERFRAGLKVAAIHKLGTYMALVEQIAYEERETGKPVSADYIPLPHEQVVFEGQVLGLGELYRMAQEIIAQHAPDDSLTNHLLSLSPSLV